MELRSDFQGRCWPAFSDSKIVIVPGLAYTFAGDECAKEVGAAVAKTIAETSEPLPYNIHR